MEVYKFSDLNKEEQDKSREVFTIIEMLKEFNNHANPRLFEFLFGERWEHLWEKFVNDSDHNLLDFFNRIDLNAKSTIITNLVKNQYWNKNYPDKSQLYSQC
jgi:hypothetical protein